MIQLAPEPTGQLLKKADVFAWAVGLTDAQWDKIRPHLTPVRLPGCKKPFYRKNQIRVKIINPMTDDKLP